MAGRTRGPLVWDDRFPAPTGLLDDIAGWLAARTPASQDGGVQVVWSGQDPEHHLLTQWRRYQLSDGSAVRLLPGAGNACHGNAALAVARRRGWQLATGWALTAGRWVLHSWALDDTCRLVETTVPRERYAGFVLDEPETLVFCMCEGLGEQLVDSDPGRWLPVLEQLEQALRDTDAPDSTDVWSVFATLPR